MKKNDDTKREFPAENGFFTRRAASEPRKKNRILDNHPQISDANMTSSFTTMNDFKNLINKNTKNKSITNILLVIVDPIFAPYQSYQDYLQVSLKIKKILSLYKKFDDYRFAIKEQIQSMQKLALLNPSQIDKTSLDYSCAMNSLCTKLEIKDECSPIKMAIESAYAYIESLCFNLERKIQNENLGTMHDLTPQQKNPANI